MTDDGRQLLFRRDLSSRQMRKAIAATLLSGVASAQFLKHLAFTFDPPSRKRPVWKIDLMLRRGNGRPTAPPELGPYLAERAPTGRKQAIYDAMQEFGVSESTCVRALKRERELRELWAWLDAKTN